MYTYLANKAHSDSDKKKQTRQKIWGLGEKTRQKQKKNKPQINSNGGNHSYAPHIWPKADDFFIHLTPDWIDVFSLSKTLVTYFFKMFYILWWIVIDIFHYFLTSCRHNKESKNISNRSMSFKKLQPIYNLQLNLLYVNESTLHSSQPLSVWRFVSSLHKMILAILLKFSAFLFDFLFDLCKTPPDFVSATFT